MKIKIPREVIPAFRGMTKTLTDNNKTMPILTNIKISAKDGQVCLLASNVNMWVRQTINCDVGEAGAIAVKAELFGGIVGSISADSVSIETDEANVRVTANDDDFEICSVDPEEFPAWPASFGETKTFKVDAASFRKAVSTSLMFVAKEQGRYALNGVRIEAGQDGVVIAGTDGHAMYFKRISSSPMPEAEAIIPEYACSALQKLDGDGDIEISVSETMIRFVLDSVEMVTLRVAGQYPDWRRVIPDGSCEEVRFDSGEIRAACGKARLLTSMESAAVVLDIKAGELQMTSKSSSGRAAVKCPAGYAGSGARIGLDPKLLTNAISALDAEQVVVEIRGAESAVFYSLDKSLEMVLVMAIDI